MKKPIIITAMIGLSLACEESSTKTVPFQAPNTVKNSADVTSMRDLIPTNPTAGEVSGKAILLDPAESERRRAINVIQPIIWGESIAGISTTTTFNEAKAILANPVSESTNLTIYSEYLGVFWNGGQPNLPQTLVAISGYAGTLELPAPYSSITTKQDISSYVDTPEKRANFIVDLERSFSSTTPDYNCLQERSCRILAFEDGSQFYDFSNGRIAVNADNTVNNIFTPLALTFPPRLTGDALLQQGQIGKYSLASTRAGVESALGGSLDLIRSPLSQYKADRYDALLEGYLMYYDDLALGVQWLEDNTPTLMAVREGFLGELVFSVNNNVRKRIGDSTIDLILTDRPDPSTLNDDDLVNTTAPALIRDIDRTLYSRADGYDCLSQNTCQLTAYFDRFELMLNTVTLVVSREPNLNIKMVAVHAARYE